MSLDAALFAGRVNFVAGFAAASGKTMLAKAILALLREKGLKCALISAGYEGGGKRRGSAAVKSHAPEASDLEMLAFDMPAFEVERDEVFSTAASMLPFLDCLPELIAGPAGSSALGPIVLARAERSGSAILAGPARSEALAMLVEAARHLPGIDAVIIDGTLDRLTQLSVLPDPQLYCAVRADRADCQQIAKRMAAFYQLVHLPKWDAPQTREGEALVFEGALSSAALEKHKGAKAVPIIIKDITRVFLRPDEIASLSVQGRLFVQQEIAFRGFIVALRDIEPEEFMSYLPHDVADSIINWNPYELETGPRFAQQAHAADIGRAAGCKRGDA